MVFSTVFYMVFILFTVTHWVAIVFAALIGAIIGFYFKKDSGVKASDNLDISNKVVKSLEKQLKEKNKLLEKLEKQKNNLSADKKNADENIDELNDELENLKVTIQNKEEENSLAISEKINLKSKVESTKKELEILKQKKGEVAKTEREWKNEINDLKRKLNDVSNRHNNLVDANENLKKQVKENSNMIQEMDMLRVENKGFKSKAKQLTNDVEYWEKMHFETHHELAELKTKEELTKKEVTEKVDLINGYKLEKEKLMSMIEEYKTKYIKANNLYRSYADKVS